MKRYFQYIIGFTIGFVCITGTIFGAGVIKNIFEEFSFKNDDVLCPGDAICPDEDTWDFTVEDILIFDSDRDGYTINKARGLLKGKILSDVYGEFSIKTTHNTEKGLIFYDSTLKKCGQKQHTYNIDGIIISERFGDLQVQKDASYFCPNSLEAFIVFHSDLLPKKIVVQSLQIEDEIKKQEIENLLTNNLSQIQDKIVFGGGDDTNIFEKQQVAIIGTTNITNADLLSESGETGLSEINISSANTPLIRSKIDQKVAQVSRNLTTLSGPSIDWSQPSATTNGENIFYYKPSSLTALDNNYGNKGEVIKIQKNSSFNETSLIGYQIEISGKNTIIADGANVYINADIYNKNSSSILTIIAKRDKNNHGGNIYIDPDVTNIDAILIADGSLLSYRNNKILNRNTDNINGLLARQLHIYGSVFTKNTLGSRKIPFGSDINFFSPTTTFSNKSENIYDLANLRAFQTRFTNPRTGANDCGGKTSSSQIKRYWTAGFASTNNEQKLDGIKKYAWSGKRKCFNLEIDNIANGDHGYNQSLQHPNLRSSGKTNSIIIEHNPVINTNTPYILQE